jgi:hypothetical protein
MLGHKSQSMQIPYIYGSGKANDRMMMYSSQFPCLSTVLGDVGNNKILIDDDVL